MYYSKNLFAYNFLSQILAIITLHNLQSLKAWLDHEISSNDFFIMAKNGLFDIITQDMDNTNKQIVIIMTWYVKIAVHDMVCFI